MLALFCLRIVHVLYSLSILFRSFWRRLGPSPLPLCAPRSRIPKHLAVLFTSDSYIDHETMEEQLLENIIALVHWCRTCGIKRLSLYDEDGVLISMSRIIQEQFGAKMAPPAAGSDHFETEFPLTPPMSDYSGSRPISPDLGADATSSLVTLFLKPEIKRGFSGDETSGGSLQLDLLSKAYFELSITTTARTLARQQRATAETPFVLSRDTLSGLLEDELSPPDFMIVHPLAPSSTYHRAPLQLHGFPAWHIKLTEIYLNRYHKRHRTWLSRLLTPREERRKLSLPLTEVEFREALDQFGCAEMRFGK